MSLDGYGHLAYILLAWGSWRIGKNGNERKGWYYRIAGSMWWAGLGYLMGYSSIIVWSLVFAGVDSVGLLRRVARDRMASERMASPAEGGSAARSPRGVDSSGRRDRVLSRSPVGSHFLLSVVCGVCQYRNLLRVVNPWVRSKGLEDGTIPDMPEEL